MTFAALGLIDPLLRALDSLDYRTPTAVQKEAIPAVLKGRDLLAAAQTGTLLAELTLPADWGADAAAGAKGLLGSWSGNVTVDGTAGYYRILDNAGTVCHEQGTIGTSGQDINLTSTALTIGQVLVITAKTLTAGNA